MSQVGHLCLAGPLSPHLSPRFGEDHPDLRPGKGSQHQWESPRKSASQGNFEAEERLWSPFCLAIQRVTAFGMNACEAALCQGRRDQNEVIKVRHAVNLTLEGMVVWEEMSPSHELRAIESKL